MVTGEQTASWIAVHLVFNHPKSNTGKSQEAPPRGRGHSKRPALAQSCEDPLHRPPGPGPQLRQASPAHRGTRRAGTQTPRPRQAPRFPPPQRQRGSAEAFRAGCSPARREAAAAARAGPARDGALQRQHPRGRTPTDLVEATLGREDGDVAVEAGAGASGHGGGGGGGAAEGLAACRAPPLPQTGHPAEYFRVTRSAQAPKHASLAYRHTPPPPLRMPERRGPSPTPPPPSPATAPLPSMRSRAAGRRTRALTAQAPPPAWRLRGSREVRSRDMSAPS